MRIHYLQHALYEDLGNIAEWAKDKGYSITSTKLFENEELPSLNEFDWLIILGGPMNIYEEEAYPWLTEEKKFIKQAIEANKWVWGICLGAQLIADVLGGKVVQNPYKEIGWFNVNKAKEGMDSIFLADLPQEFMAFHWHGDTVELPGGAVRLAQNQACVNQAFAYNSRVLALQFHLEFSEDMIRKMIEGFAYELVEGKYIQNKKTILSMLDQVPLMKSLLYQLLNRFETVAE